MNRSDWISFLLALAALATCTAAFSSEGDATSAGSVGSVPGSQTVRTTLCELAAAPERYQGKVVEVRAVVQTGFQTYVLRDDTCSTFIWLSGIDPTQSAPEGAAGAALRKDRQFQKMQDYLNKKYKPTDGTVCSRCPLYTVTATVVGRFEHVSKGEAYPKAGGVTGFGYLNSYDSQLVLLGVSNVVAQPIDRSAGKK